MYLDVKKFRFFLDGEFLCFFEGTFDMMCHEAGILSRRFLGHSISVKEVL